MHRVLSLLALIAVASAAVLSAARAAGAPDKDAQLFGSCAACHSLQPDVNMTGPSLHGLWGRRAGTFKSFGRYSPALKASNVVWNDQSLDAWLKNPAQFIPHNWMPFRGISDPKARATLIAYLKVASESQPAMPKSQALGHPNLKKAALADQVKAIRYCENTHAYYVTSGDNDTRAFWEANLRFKTDSSELGPAKGAPAILRAGMQGDRASVFFASPEEISTFIKPQC